MIKIRKWFLSCYYRLYIDTLGFGFIHAFVQTNWQLSVQKMWVSIKNPTRNWDQGRVTFKNRLFDQWFLSVEIFLLLSHNEENRETVTWTTELQGDWEGIHGLPEDTFSYGSLLHACALLMDVVFYFILLTACV